MNSPVVTEDDIKDQEIESAEDEHEDEQIVKLLLSKN